MNLINGVLIVALLLILRLIYNSFMYEEDLYFFVYQVTHIELVAIFYLLLLLTFYVITKKIKLGFAPLHLLLSISLFFIGEYSYDIVLQFIFLVVFFDIKSQFLKTIFISIYLLAVHKALLLLFASSYLLYFINLSLVIYLLFKSNLFKGFTEKSILACGIVFIFLIAAVLNLENIIFDLYIWLDIVDTQTYQTREVLYILSLIHISVFAYKIGYNKKNYLRY